MIRTRFPTVLVAIGLAVVAEAGPPDFTLTSGETTFRLSDARGRFVALHFLLKTECPLCQRHVAEMARRAPELAGVMQVYLKPDAQAEVDAWAAKLRDAGVSATIYRDADAALAKAYAIPDGYDFHGQTMHYPALVLLGPDGMEVHRYVGKSNNDRQSFDALAQKVAELSKNPALAQYNLSDRALAIQGYDPVAYFEAGKAEAGKPEFSSQYRGVTYQFSSAARRAKFAAMPEKYAPAYGGWCATAMAEGRKVEIDAGNFKITDGRLFLFYKGWLGNALNDWNKDEKSLIDKADAQWRKLAPGDAAK